MTDVVTPQVRSKMMAGIRGKNTKPELLIRQYLHKNGFRYRLHAKNMAGKPDIVLPKWNAALFVHGCFWHRHEGCRYNTTPATRADFWRAKFEGNVKRDRQHVLALETAGWRVAIIWECSLRGVAVEPTCHELAHWLKSHDSSRFETLPSKSSIDC